MILLATAIAMPSFADDKLRVAIFDPVSNGDAIDEGTKIAIREIISSTIVNSGDYNIVERSLLDKIMQEQQFSNSGVVDDNDAVEIGKLTGANKIVLSLITSSEVQKGLLTYNQYMLSIKIVDVKTASVERQKVQLMTSRNYLDVTASLTQEVLGRSAPSEPRQVRRSEPQTKPERQPGSTVPKPEKAPKRVKKAETEFTLYMAPGYMPDNDLHKDNSVEVLIDGKYAGMGTLSSGFEIHIKDKKPKKYRVEFHPTSTHDNGKVNNKSGMTVFHIDTHYQQMFEFEVQAERKGKWTIYTIQGK